MRCEVECSHEEFKLKGRLLLLVVAFGDDGVLLEGLQALVVLEGNVGQLGQLPRKQLPLDDQVSVLLKVLLP
jgi:hypothetical protein